MGECQKDYIAVGEKCYSVPGLPFGFNFWSANELCSNLKGHLFHVDNISQWQQLNYFLTVTIGTRLDRYLRRLAESFPKDSFDIVDLRKD